MSDISYAPPPPPPTPPPAGPPAQGSQFDFLKPFTFLFQDPRWLTKVLLGGLFYLATIVIVGIFFVLGYCAQLARNVIAGVEHPAPEWDDLGGFFAEGLRMFGVMVVYVMPIFAITIAIVMPAIISGALSEGHDISGALAGGFMTCGVCLILPLGLAMSFWLPGALLMCVSERRFGAAFEFRRIWDFISGNFVNYLLAFLVYLIARFAVGFGILLFCVGVFFTAFWAFVVATYGFAQAYRVSGAR